MFIQINGYRTLSEVNFCFSVFRKETFLRLLFLFSIYVYSSRGDSGGASVPSKGINNTNLSLLDAGTGVVVVHRFTLVGSQCGQGLYPPSI